MLIRQILQTDLHIIFVLQAVFQDIKLQHADYTYDDLFQTGIELLEDLNGTFLRDLFHTLDELFSLHGIHLTYSGKMLRCESGNSFVLELFLGHTQSITDGEDTGIEHTDNISGIGLV